MKGLETFPKLDRSIYMGHVYAIVNEANGNRYIGSSINIRRRLRGHISALRLNRHYSKSLQADFNEFGVDNFRVELLSSVEMSSRYSKKAKLVEHQMIYEMRPEYNTQGVPPSKEEIEDLKKRLAA